MRGRPLVVHRALRQRLDARQLPESRVFTQPLSARKNERAIIRQSDRGAYCAKGY